MADKRYILLEVEAPRAEELLEALLKRSYIKHITLSNKDDRDLFENCPACERRFARESVVTVTDEMLEALLRIAVVMKTTKAVVFYNAKIPFDSLRLVDHSRAVEFQHYLMPKAENLGLIAKFVDGTQDTYHLTMKAIGFLAGKEPLSPCKLIIAEGVVLSSSGSMMIEEVKSKDRIKLHRLIAECKSSIRAIPDQSVEFIISGQMPLLG